MWSNYFISILYPHHKTWNFLRLNILISIWHCQSFNFNHPGKYAVIFHWGFNLCALTINDVEHFHVLTGDNYLFTYLSAIMFSSISDLLYTILMYLWLAKGESQIYPFFRLWYWFQVWTKKTTLNKITKILPCFSFKVL